MDMQTGSEDGSGVIWETFSAEVIRIRASVRGTGKPVTWACQLKYVEWRKSPMDRPWFVKQQASDGTYMWVMHTDDLMGLAQYAGRWYQPVNYRTRRYPLPKEFKNKYIMARLLHSESE